ncbi:hypothetical protein QBC42DRAFT_349732 [Cladorrhinum samala]|uniref:Uncharacterized protein n=1 Tax=Cladorrhinum samala TaxID=585594 RepID=A0AAV9HCC9_9PEZI|nr:hypothetical protein QBC42DRAFT_349732 [Cladorrhinum samala]
MIGGRQVLLSLAVLYSAGPNSVLGGVLRPQDGAQGFGRTVIANTTREASSSSLQLETTATTTSTTITSKLSSLAEPNTTLQSSIRRPPALPPFAGVPSVVSSVVETSSVVLGLGVIHATADAGAASPTSTGEEYLYPAVNGADGPLTTESEAYTRSVVPTRKSIAPNQGTGRAPPPMDVIASSTFTSSTARVMPTRPPPRPEPVISDPADQPEDTQAPVETRVDASAAPPEETFAGPSRQPEVVVVPTPPRGGPPGLPTKTTATTVEGTTLTFVVGHGSETSSPPTASSTWARYSNSSAFYPNQTVGAITSAPTASSPLTFCQASDYTKPSTIWSIVHTETITWYGNPEDYTPSYPPIVTPTPGRSCVDIIEPPRLTLSICTSTGADSKYVTCQVSTSTESWNFGTNTKPPPNPITFLTTDKNPAVVFSTIETPDYGVSQEASTRHNHASPTDHQAPISTPQYQSEGPGRNTAPQYMSDPTKPGQPPTTPRPSPITVIVQPTQVIIGSTTITDQTSANTQVVVVGGETFTINPTQVVGGGTTITRPGSPYVPPTTTTLATIPVVVSSSVAIIGSSTFKLGPTTTTAVVGGKTFTIGPSAIAVETQTFNLPPPAQVPAPTEVVVAGGEVVTAIGPSVIVIKSTTITYGPSILTTQVGDEVLTIGPGGVTLGSGEVLTAKKGETQYAVAGGVTVTKIGADVVVVGGKSYTVGPKTGEGGAPATTATVTIGGEIVKIGPGGVEVGTLTMEYPFGITAVITPGARATAQGGHARETGRTGAGTGTGISGEGGEEEGEEDAAGTVRPGLGLLGSVVLGWWLLWGLVG